MDSSSSLVRLNGARTRHHDHLTSNGQTLLGQTLLDGTATETYDTAERAPGRHGTHVTPRKEFSCFKVRSTIDTTVGRSMREGIASPPSRKRSTTGPS